MIKIEAGGEWPTAFRTKYGLFKTLVILFGLTNTTASFEVFINKTLELFLNIFCTAFLNNILILSNDMKKCKEHIRAIMKC